MKTTLLLAASFLLLVTSHGLAQTPPAPLPPGVSPIHAQRQARRTALRTKLAHVTPTERHAFKQARHQHRQAKLQAMRPAKRARVLARRQVRKAVRQSQG